VWFGVMDFSAWCCCCLVNDVCYADQVYVCALAGQIIFPVSASTFESQVTHPARAHTSHMLCLQAQQAACSMLHFLLRSCGADLDLSCAGYQPQVGMYFTVH
jgi:hypothetical protein